MSQLHASSDPIPAELEICPYLGIEEDAQTCLGYPSHWNYCHRCKPIAAVRISHQRSSCFSSTHPSCPVAASQKPEPLPSQLRGGRKAIK